MALNKVDDLMLNSASLAEKVSQADIANYVIYGSQFGISTANADNHDNIINALNQIKTNGGGTLLLPFGIIKTSPLNLLTYKNIVIKGVGRSKPWNTVTTVKLIASGDVGIQFADSTFPMTTFIQGATDCSLEDLYVDCNNMVNAGVNANYAITLKNITVRHAIQDGIRLEDYTYPIYMDKIESSYNGRHGLYVRGHMTTKYFARECAFDFNTGYGIYLEGGATVTFQDCTTQSNTRGGVKLSWKGDTLPDGITYLQNILFINHYWEANGTLATNDPNYEGNYGLVITSTNKTSAANNKPSNIRFVAGLLNASSGGNCYLFDSVYGLNFDGLVTDHTKGVISTPAACHSLMTNTGTTSGDNSVNAPYPFITSYGLNDTVNNVPFKYTKGGTLSNRGRYQTYYFTLDPSILVASGTTLMTPAFNYGNLSFKPKGYPVPSVGSIVRLHLRKSANGGSPAGTVTAKPLYVYDSAFSSDPTTLCNSASFLTLTLPTNSKATLEVPALSTPIYAGTILGVQLSASADYVQGTQGSYILEMLVEY